jgi:hypothetical protein
MLRILVLVLPLSCLFVVGASSAPTISVDGATYAATVQPGEEVVHVFKLMNTGNETLSISNVLASCGCTATSLEKTMLSPGESVGLETKVNTTGFQGTVDKRVTVQSNDPVTPDLFLHLMLAIAGAAQPQAGSPASALPQGTPPTPPSAADEPRAAKSEGQLIVVVGVAGAAVGFGLGIAVSRMHWRKRQG